MNLKDFAWLFTAAAKEDLLEEWLDFLFTPAELEDLNKRLDLIAALVKDKETQREIARNHAVSIAKITRGSNALKRISPEFRQFLVQHFGNES